MQAGDDSVSVPGNAGKEKANEITQYNLFGSFGSFHNGIRAGFLTRDLDIKTDYGYRNFDGYREHSNLYAHDFNLELTTAPSTNSGVRIAGSYYAGRSQSPGSLTLEEFNNDPRRADPRAVGRKEFRQVSRGRVDAEYFASFGKKLNHEVVVTGTGQIEYLERCTREFKIATSYILGLSARYTYTGHFWGRKSSFSAGAEISDEPERKEEYENFGGRRSDFLEQIELEKTVGSGCFFREEFEILPDKLLLKMSERYHHVIYTVSEATLPARSDKRIYNAFIPEVTLEYKLLKALKLFGTYTSDFRYPTFKELESPDPSYMYNQDLEAQKSTTWKAGLETGIKKTSRFFRAFSAEAAVFRTGIRNEIVQYEIYGDLFYRNAAKTERLGAYLKGKLGIFDDLDLTFGYTWARYQYKTYTTESLETDSAGGIISIQRDFADHFEPNIPQHWFTCALAYRHPIGKWLEMTEKLGYLASSGMWVDDHNSGKSGAYSLLNAEAGFNFHFHPFLCSVKGGVNNIFDKVYVGRTNINSADRRYYDAGSPREFFIAVDLRFVF